jgi:glycosyltransferase involved in cell wall biosynthesis
VADERDLAVRAHLRATAPHLAAAGYRLSFVAASQEALISIVGERLRTRAYALVHVHGAWLAPVACLAGLLSSAPPLIVSLREPPGACGVQRWLLGRALARADAIVAACEDDRAAVLRRFPNLRRHQGRIVAIADGVEGPTVREGGEDEEETVIGCALACERGRDLMLEVLARLARFGNLPPFRVEAFAPEVAHYALAKAVAARGLERLIDVLPAASDCAVRAGLFVALSRADAQSAMQAMCAGVPLVAPGCAGLREILDGSPARVYAPNTAASLETALRQALSEPGEEARRYTAAARERFDAGRAGARLVELYDRLTAAEPAARAA